MRAELSSDDRNYEYYLRGKGNLSAIRKGFLVTY